MQESALDLVVIKNRDTLLADIADSIDRERQATGLLPSELDEMVRSLSTDGSPNPHWVAIKKMAIVGVGVDRVIQLAEPISEANIVFWAERMRANGDAPLAADNGSRSAARDGAVRSFVRQQALRELYQ